jgi:hypothetical protein
METQPDRPSRLIEHAIQQTNELFVRMEALANQFQSIAERLQLGADVKSEGTVGREAAVAVPELAELADNHARMRIQVERLERLLGTFEAI